MKILIIQRHAGYRFMGLFADAFIACGHTVMNVPHEKLRELPSILEASKPDVAFSVQLAPFLFRLPIPTIHYELDMIMNWDLLRDRPPGPNDLFFIACRDDIAPLRAAGAQHVEYLPFCANIEAHTAPATTHRFDVSFVGSILQEIGNQYREVISTIRSAFANNAMARPIADEVQATLEQILAKQDRALQHNRYVLKEETRKRLKGVTADVMKAANISAATLISILAKEAAHRQRMRLLQSVPGLTVFGAPDWPAALPGATYGGPVNQFDAAGTIFNQSRINLHMQRIYALSGLSDRVFNITASGGFLLSDRNQAVQAAFDEGKDAAMFSSPEELVDKVTYYRAHETERARIAQNGYDRTMREHLPVNRVRSMLDRLK